MINDAFWCITLGTIVIAWFWKREKRKSKDRKYQKQKEDRKIEEAKQEEVIAKYTEAFGRPMTKEEEKAEKLRKEIADKRAKDEAELRKQGYTDELIAVILPTINNGE